MTSARRPVDADLRAEAVRLVAEVGLAEATRRTGLPRSSISRWARAAGVDGVGVSIARNREAVLVAADRRKLLLAEADERAVTLLTGIRDLALQKTVERIKQGSMDDRSLIGAWTRATHDLALLSGQATERLASEPVNVDVQVTVRTDLAERLGAMARRMAPEAIDVPPPPGGNGSANGHGEGP